MSNNQADVVITHLTMSAIGQSRILPTRMRPDIRVLPRPGDVPLTTKTEGQPESPLPAPQPRKRLPPKEEWFRTLQLQIPGSPCIGECGSNICRQGSPNAMTWETSLHSTRRYPKTSDLTAEQIQVEPSETITSFTCDQEYQSTIVTNLVPVYSSDATGNDAVPNDPDSRLTGFDSFEKETARPFSTTPRAMSLSELYATTSMSQTGTSDCK
jgi:hypothetical protein